LKLERGAWELTGVGFGNHHVAATMTATISAHLELIVRFMVTYHRHRTVSGLPLSRELSARMNGTAFSTHFFGDG